MNRRFLVITGVLIALVAGIIHGQGTLEVRAAASSAVTGWQQMTSPSGDRVWVSPTSRLTSADIERADARTMPNGDPAAAVVLTAAGAKKMEELSASQMNKPIALLLDGKLIWAPIVRGSVGKEAVLSGGPGGLTPTEIQRLLASVKGQ